jgi:uncharacterized protein
VTAPSPPVVPVASRPVASAAVDVAEGDVSAVDVAEVVTVLCSWVHAAGIPLTPERIARFARSVRVTNPSTVEELRWLARATLTSSRAQWSTLDAVLDQVIRGHLDDLTRGAPGTPTVPTVQPGTEPRPQPPKDDRRDAQAAPGAGRPPSPKPGGDTMVETENERVEMSLSAQERLGERDFASVTSEELVELAALLRGLTVVAPRRRTHRRRRHQKGSAVDLRRTLRAAHRTGADPVRLARRAVVERDRRVVLLADVSGSMERYARAYLYLLHATVRSVRAEAFLFSTRLTRVTTALRVSSPEVAMRRAAESAPDWSGGTRIGEAIETFLARWGRSGMARGAVVVILSDGWEAGDAAHLGEQMARLSRLAHRVVWVNPRRSDPRYEPRVAGMAAALPHVDAFVSGHSVVALRELLDEIAT